MTERLHFLHFLLLWSTGSGACGLSDGSSQAPYLWHRLHGCTACGIFPDQGSNPRSLRQQADSLPLSYQGSPLALLKD